VLLAPTHPTALPIVGGREGTFLFRRTRLPNFGTCDLSPSHKLSIPQLPLKTALPPLPPKPPLHAL
jgi:hypothetical protein